jgi:hypothetical protein
LKEGMYHRLCGGHVKADPGKSYKWDNSGPGEVAEIETMPAYVCSKCGAEIISDDQIDLYVQGELYPEGSDY